MSRLPAIAAPVLAVASVLSAGPALARCPAGATTAALSAGGSYTVAQRTLVLEDASRPITAHGHAPAAPARPIAVEVWYPVGSGGDGTTVLPRAFPLVVNSPGLFDFRLGEDFFTRSLASRGFVVASIDFPRTNIAWIADPSGPDLTDFHNQPGDVSFVIDTLLREARTPGSWLARGVDRKRIGLVGLSLGGATTMVTTFHPTLRDRRVRAALPIAGFGGCALRDEFFRAARPPLLVLHGDQDLLVPFEASAASYFALARSSRQLVRLHEATHTAFSTFAINFPPGLRYDIDIGCVGISSVLEWGDPFAALAGPRTGVDLGATKCALPCQGPLPTAPPMTPARQHELTRAIVHAFFESMRGSKAARCFLREVLASENADVTVASAPKRPLRGR
jgi:dienelactone hydrolase